MRKTASEIEELRQQAVEMWLEGRLTISEIAKRLNTSRKFVYTTLQRFHNDTENPYHDKRRGNASKPLYEGLAGIVMQVRSEHPDWGPVMIAHYLEKHKDEYGLTQVPHPQTIAVYIRELGIARKPVGPKDKRLYPDPDARPNAPGTLTLDLWGPWRLRATKLYLVTVQDRFTRASAAVPATSLEFGQELAPGVSVNTWIHAIQVGIKYLLPEGVAPRALYVDNGVGLAPVFGVIPRSLRYALAVFPKVVFIPPAQPWRNGRLERFHWTMEREYFARERPNRPAEALTGLVEWLNWYNTERPHTALGFKAPSSLLAAGLPPLTVDALTRFCPPPDDLNVIGFVEAVRMVEDGGKLVFWQESDPVFLPEVLAGQYVRVQLFWDGTGRVLWNRKKGDEPIVVADFEHGLGKKAIPLVRSLVPREFGYSVPNQRIDQYAYENAKRRRGKQGTKPPA